MQRRVPMRTPPRRPSGSGCWVRGCAAAHVLQADVCSCCLLSEPAIEHVRKARCLQC